MFCSLNLLFVDVLVAALIGRRSCYRGLEIARNCGSGKIKGARNCGYVRMEKLTCAVFHVSSGVEKCSKVRFSQLCETSLNGKDFCTEN